MEIRSQRGFPQRLGKHKALSTVPTRPDGGSTDLIHQQGGAKSNDQKGPNQVDGSKNLYIVVKSAKNDRNELVVKPTEETEERWKGKGVTNAEVAIVYEGKVWSPEALPKRFDLSKAVIVSFEESKIRFFDFQAMSGGYFDRISD